MLGRSIVAVAAIGLAAMLMSHSQTGMRSAVAALGITAKGKRPIWDYNPLTLLSRKRLKKILAESTEASKFEKPKLLYDGVDLSRFK